MGNDSHANMFCIFTELKKEVTEPKKKKSFDQNDEKQNEKITLSPVGPLVPAFPDEPGDP